MTEALFADRTEAGHKLAWRLWGLIDEDSVVMAIPRGGVPVAAAAAGDLRLEWGVVVARKLPIPWSPEAGFGAVTADEAAVLNKAVLAELRMTTTQIDQVIRRVREEANRRSEIYRPARPMPEIEGRTVIVVDDGVASGYTILAAMGAMRRRGALKVIAAAPVASQSTAAMVAREADAVAFENVSSSVPFAVADAYITWRDLTDDDILPLMAQAARGNSTT